MTQTSQVCLSCGNKHRKTPPKGKAIGCWAGKCDVCGYEGIVTSPRDFGYPEFPKEKKP